MRTLNILAVAALVSVSAACASQKAPAEAAVQALDAAAAAARPEIERFAPDRWPAAAEAVAGVQTKLAAADYAGVLADVQGAHARVDEATKAAAERKAALVQEWGAFAGIPAMVQRATQKIAEITASRRMPRGMDRASLDGAQATISRVTGMMAEASQAYETGDLAAAVAKARDIKSLMDPLMVTLGLAAS